MKTFLIAFLAVTAIACVVALGENGFEKRPTDKLVYCERSIEESTGDEWVELKSTPNCGDEKKNKQQQSQDIRARFSTSDLPEVFYEASRKATDRPHTETRISILEIIEYKENNAQPGFQPGQDMIIKRYPLGKVEGKAMGRNQTFAAPKRSSTQVGDKSTDVARSVSTRMNRTMGAGKPHFIADVEFKGDMAPREVTLKPKNGTKPDNLLTPDAFKITLSLLNIRYNSSVSTGIAVKVAYTTKGANTNPTQKTNGQSLRPAPKKDDGTNGKAKGDKAPTPAAGTDGKTPIPPTEATKDQGVYAMGDDKAGFFSFNQYVDVTDANNVGGVRDLISHGPVASLVPPSPDFNSTKPGQKFPPRNSRALINREAPKYQIMWFSVAERVNSLVWDPTVGSTETANADLDEDTSAASPAAVASLSVVFTAIVAALLL